MPERPRRPSGKTNRCKIHLQSPTGSGSEAFGPSLAPVQHAQDFDSVSTNSVGRDEGGLDDHQFARARPSTGAAALGKLEQTGDRGEHMGDLIVSRRRIVEGEVGPGGSEVAYGGFSPN